MTDRLYKPRNYLSLLTHYGAAAGLAAGAVAIAAPWALITAGILVGGVSYFAIKAQKQFLENNLVKHPDASEISPHLGEIAKELYKKSGLKAEGNPIYDFKSDDKKVEKGGVMTRVLAKVQDLMARTHNAAALQLGKPVIMISTPLLKLLDDKEEKAVLAHEFAHAAARHQHVSLPLKLVTGVAASAVGLTLIGALFTIGWAPIIASTAASIVAGIAFKKVIGEKKADLLDKDDEKLTLPELSKKKKLDKAKTAITSAIDAGVVGLYSPAYLLLYVASKATGTAGKLINAAFSRSIEYQADRGAVTFGADPLALMTGLRKIELVVERSTKAAFGGELPEKNFLTKIWRKLTVDHPTTENRVIRLGKMAKKQGVSQELIEKAAKGALEVPADNDMPPALLQKLACGHLV